ncbi:MAG: pitrilysin family protein, partial [Pseudomonadota bacterium]
GRAVVAQGEAFDPSPANVEARTQRFTLPGGLKAALLPKKTKGATVSVVMALRMGTDESLKGKAQTGQFAARLLMSGTERLSRQEIKDGFDKLKAQVSVSGGAEGVSVSITATRENLPAAMDLMAEVLKKSTFPAKEFQEQQLAAINEAEQNIPEPQPLAANAMSRLIDAYPLGHVRHVGTLQEQLADTKAVTVDQVKAFHAAYYGADNANFSAVGDFDAVALKTQLNSLFGSWKATQPYVRIPSIMKAAAGAKVSMETPDKANSMLFAIQPLVMKDSAENYPALLIANHMLGGGALRSRLADRIRQKEGLSYGVGSQVSAPALDPAGLWLAYAISAPQNTGKVEAALREEVQKAITEGFTEDELTEAKKGWKQSAEVVRTQDPSLARRLSAYLNIDRTLAYDKDLEAKVAALTVAQVNEALRQNLKVVNLSFITAGDFAKAAKDAAAK